MAMKLRPSRPAGQYLVPLAEQVQAASATGNPLPELRVTGVTLRGQDARPGDLFAALPGSAVHGARYAPDAVAAGAVAVLTDAAGAAELDALEVPILVHPDPRSVLGEVAAEVY